jgi:hypothetical protein
MISTDTAAGTLAPHGQAGARRPLRSIGAVFGGLATTFIVTLAVDMALYAAGVFPPFSQRMSDALFVLALAYRLPFNVAGSYVTARLAPARLMAHAVALGITGTVLATIGAVVMGNHGPAWYSVANIVIALPCAWAGGRIVRRAAERGHERGSFV